MLKIKKKGIYMSSVVFTRQDATSLIDHHIALLKRFDVTEDNEFSVIYFSFKDKANHELSVIFQKLLRKTDALFQDENSMIVFLPGTDWNGATELLSGIQDFLNQPLNDNIVTYPVDGENATDMLDKLKKLVKENENVDLNF